MRHGIRHDAADRLFRRLRQERRRLFSETAKIEHLSQHGAALLRQAFIGQIRLHPDKSWVRIPHLAVSSSW